MKSRNGLLAATVLLLALPVTLVVNAVLVDSDRIVIHIALATGFILIAASTFDFETPNWIAWPACAAIAAQSAIFLLQAVSEAAGSASLHRFAYELLGQSLEAVLFDVLFIWCFAVLVSDSRGRTRAFGLLVMSAVAFGEVYGFLGSAPEALKVLYLAPVAWLLLESIKDSAEQAERPGLAMQVA
jgi:hypothetical protein